MKDEKELAAEAAQLMSGGRPVTQIKFRRSSICRKQVCAPGYIWYEYWFNIGKVRYQGGVQINRAYEERVGREAVETYVTEKYILKKPEPKADEQK